MQINVNGRYARRVGVPVLGDEIESRAIVSDAPCSVAHSPLSRLCDCCWELPLANPPSGIAQYRSSGLAANRPRPTSTTQVLVHMPRTDSAAAAGAFRS